MKIAVTGASGFVGWHLRCRAFADGVESVPVARGALADPEAMAGILRNVGAVVHCAGVNRGPETEVVDGNLRAARDLAEGIRRADRPVRVVYANSVHARGNGGFGMAKRKAADLLAEAASGGFSDVVLPNLYGEHGRPYYNSFVATFCRNVADGRQPSGIRDREVALLHAQDAARVLLREAHATGVRSAEPAGLPVRVTAVLRLLTEFASVYRSGEIPDLTAGLRTSLFQTYRSYLFPSRYPIPLARRTDPRGDLVECVRTAVTGGQAFISSTLPGTVRGEHVHLRKFERFVVVAGSAEIALRRLFTDHVIRLRVDGENPGIVDIPTMWTHRLASVDENPVTTFFWTNETYRPGDADTYPCPVEDGAGTP